MRRREAPGHQCGGQEQEHGDHALACTDGEGEARRDEQEVVGQETQDRGHHRHAGACACSHQHHRDDEHHRQVGHAHPVFGQPRHRTGQRGSDQGLCRFMTDTAHWRQQALAARACACLRRADDGDLVMRATLDQLLGQGAVEHPCQWTFAGPAQHQGRHAVVCGMVEQGIGDARSMQQFGVAAQPPCQRKGRIDLAPGRLVLAPASRSLPSTARHGALRCAAPRAPGIRSGRPVDGHQNAATQGQIAFATRGAGFAQAAVDAVGGFLHRQFAQRSGWPVRRTPAVPARPVRAHRPCPAAGERSVRAAADRPARCRAGGRARTVSLTRTPVIRITTSLRLSRCWMLTVVQTSMPASSSSITSCQRRSWRLPGALRWASSSTSTNAGCRASTASRSISCRAWP